MTMKMERILYFALSTFTLLSGHSALAQRPPYPFVPDFQVNENVGAGGHAQGAPSIAVDGAGNFVVAWQDSRNDSQGDIYAQRYSSDGASIGSNFKVNDDQGSGLQKSPSVACDENGKFIVTWHDRRDEDDIYAQCYSGDGIPLGSNFRVCDDDGRKYQGSPCVASDRNGKFIIAWRDCRTYGHNIYAQLFTSDGMPIGDNFRVKDQDEGIGDCTPSIDCDGDGNFVITWSAKRHNNYAVLGKSYLSNGTPLTNNFEIHLDERGDSFPSVSIDENSGFVITWKDVVHNGNSDIYAQRYINSGIQIGDNFKVNDDLGTEAQLNPSVDSDSLGNFVVVWADRRNDVHDITICAQRYSDDGTPVGDNFQVTRVSRGQQDYPDVELWNRRIYTTWIAQSASGNGYDIWANILYWQKPVLSQSSFTLYQNYPNPFNSGTEIWYDIPIQGNVKLAVYNLLGQVVKVLVDENQEVKEYVINWDGTNLKGEKAPSGLYLYRLETGSVVLTKKMLCLE